MIECLLILGLGKTFENLQWKASTSDSCEATVATTVFNRYVLLWVE